MSLIGPLPQTDAIYPVYMKVGLKDVLVFLENDPATALGKGIKGDIATLYNLARQMAWLEGFMPTYNFGQHEALYDQTPFFYRRPVWEVVVSAWDEANQNLLASSGPKVTTDEQIKETGNLIISSIGTFLFAAEYKTAEENYLLAVKGLDEKILKIRVYDERDCGTLGLMGYKKTLSERFDFQKAIAQLQKFVTLVSTKLEAL